MLYKGTPFGLGVALLAVCSAATPARAQTAPPPADAAPAIHVGVQLFADYTVQQQPKVVDADGNTVTLNQFQITRSYINVTGNLSRTIAFQITPDVTREISVGSSLDGSYAFRLKYAFAQWNLDDHLGKGSWARFGMQPTPWIGFIDEVYRYRFQGQGFEERDGFIFSSDVGATFHYDLPRDFGDLHAGVFNGEGYSKPEVNDQKGWMIRGTVRPMAAAGGVLHGVRVSGFFDHDMYVKSADRQRAIVAVTFQHRFVNAAVDYLMAKDQPSETSTAVDARGWSAWVTPRTSNGWEGLLRVDHVQPSTEIAAQHKHRTIAGIAYWFPHQGSVSSALLFDVDNLKLQGFTATQAPLQRRIALHALVNF